MTGNTTGGNYLGGSYTFNGRVIILEKCDIHAIIGCRLQVLK